MLGDDGCGLRAYQEYVLGGGEGGGGGRGWEVMCCTVIGGIGGSVLGGSAFGGVVLGGSIASLASIGGMTGNVIVRIVIVRQGECHGVVPIVLGQGCLILLIKDCGVLSFKIS